MAGGIDKIENIFLSLMGVIDLDGVTLDGDPFFPFEVHIIQHLGLHIPFGDRVGYFQETVRQGTFSVVDMGDNAKIPYIFHWLQKYANTGCLEPKIPYFHTNSAYADRSLHHIKNLTTCGACLSAFL
jgi:hypothetical protein